MVKKYWLAIVLVAGIAVGVALHAWLSGGNVESDAWLAEGAGRARAAEAVNPAEPAGAPKTAAAAETPPGAKPGPARFADRTAARPGDPPAEVTLDIVQAGPGGGSVQGDAINAPRVMRVENMHTMHEEFVREQRDDSWAYLREAELENSVVMETGVGDFSRDRIECRATICEMDLSARGEQIEKLKKWYDDLNAQHPALSINGPLLMHMSSFSSDNEKAEVKFLYVKPQRVLPRPAQN